VAIPSDKTLQQAASRRLRDNLFDCALRAKRGAQFRGREKNIFIAVILLRNGGDVNHAGITVLSLLPAFRDPMCSVRRFEVALVAEGSTRES
jgi:hypothetical protein